MTARPDARSSTSGFFALRTPLWPLREAELFGEGLKARTAFERGEDLDAALTEDRQRLRAAIQDALARPEVRDAIFVASPDLDDGIAVWQHDPDGERGRRVERALVRYLSRMASRATPFGLFAGCSVGRIAEKTRLVLGPRDRYERHTRLDMDYLLSLTSALIEDPEIRETLPFKPNSSLYRTPGHVRYVEVRWDGKTRSHHLVAIPASAYLDAALERAATGATPEQLRRALHDAGLSAATGFVESLISEQVLVAELGPTVTGAQPLDPLIQQLRKNPRTEFVGDRLEKVGTVLAKIDGEGIGVPPARYKEVAHSLEELPAKVEMPRLFQIDMVKPAPEATLSNEVVEEIARGIQILQRLEGPPGENELRRFRDEFIARYEGRAVPLVEALDGEAGIGFGRGTEPTPLLKGLAFPPAPDVRVPWGRRGEVLLAKLLDATERGVSEIVLSQQDIDAIAEGVAPMQLPRALAAMATVIAPSEEALDRGAFEVRLNNAGGPSGARLLGRFCHADPALRESVEHHLRQEEALDPNAVFAEIVHLPEGRIGNILLRPLVRDHEIAYLGRSGAPEEQQIPVTDLLVSVVGEQIVLTSRRLGRRVMPRLTSAHNFTGRSVPLYRFLCALQSHGVAGGLGWNWGALRTSPFLPRVRFGRVVLSLATWRIAKEELRRLGAASGTELFRAVQMWRDERRLPRHVILADYDNTLLIDLDNISSVESFVHLVKRRDEATLEELYPGPDRLCAHGPEGSFVHEIVVPFINGQPPEVDEREQEHAALATEVPRIYAPGSEWVYLKLYTGEASADVLLRDLVAPLREKVVDEGAADSWFFIRYGDPEYHLRVRFQGDPHRLRDEVLPEIQAAVAPFIEQGLVWRLQLDTYERETERYGGPDGIGLAEMLFHIDSEAVIEILRRLERGDEGARERWQLALRGIDSLLNDLGLEAEGKLAVMRRVRAGFAAEHRLNPGLGRQIGERFREQRSTLEALVDPGKDESSPLQPGFEILRTRSEQMAPIIGELRARERAGRLTLSFEELAPSYIHMHANRMLRSAFRAQELVIYSFLVRLYESRVRRGADS